MPSAQETAMKAENQVAIHPLAQFAATLQWSQVPAAVQRKAEDLWVDWFGSVLAGQNARPVHSIARFALSQGPAQGPCEVIGQSARQELERIQLCYAAHPSLINHNIAHLLDTVSFNRLDG